MTAAHFADPRRGLDPFTTGESPMATEEQMTISRLGGGRHRMRRTLNLTMVAGATVTDSNFTPPLGSSISNITWASAANFTGAPTNINLTVGKTAGAGDYVTAVDVKTAASPATTTLVSQPDYVSWPANQTIFVTLTAVGGTNPAGTCTVWIDYGPPNF